MSTHRSPREVIADWFDDVPRDHALPCAGGILDRLREAGYVVAPVEIIGNYARSTHIPRHRRICEALLGDIEQEGEQ